MLKQLLAIFIVLSCITPCMAQDFTGKKVLFVDSYHKEYPWSAGLEEGINTIFANKGIELKVIHMDTKRNTSEDYKLRAGEKAKSIIENFQPDVVIAGDDNASKYLVSRYYRNAALPFVFCGVNWSGEAYGYPYANVSGILEVAPVNALLDTLTPLAKGKRIGFLAADTPSDRIELSHYQNKLGLNISSHYFVTSFAEWKYAYKSLQDEVDMLIVAGVVGLPDFDSDEAINFIYANTSIPTGCCNDFLAPYTLLAFSKVAQEQGGWAATAALKILSGTSPADIPVAMNTDGLVIINSKVSEATGIEFPIEIIESASRIIE